MSSMKRDSRGGEVAEFSADAKISAGFNFDHDDEFFIPNKDPAYTYRHVAKENVERRRSFEGYEVVSDAKSRLPGMIVMRCRNEDFQRRDAKRRKRSAINRGMDPSQISGGYALPEHGTSVDRVK